MPVKNFSSTGGYAVDATEVLNTSRALKNISAMHMVSDHFTDANKDIFILKRQTDASNNTQQLSLDGNTPLHLALNPFNREIAEYLISAGADEELKNWKGISSKKIVQQNIVNFLRQP